ncbi:MAG: septum formation initiator family protein [bacterium]
MRNNKNIKIKYKNTNALLIVFITFIFFVLAFVVVKLSVTTVYATKGDEIASITTERLKLVEENKKIETEIAQYQSLSRIESEAKNRLGMVKANKVVYIDLQNK